MEALVQAAFKAQQGRMEFTLKQWRAGSQTNWRDDLLAEANARRAALCEPVKPCAVHFNRTRLFEHLYQESLQGVW